MKKAYITIIQDQDHIDQEPVYEINDKKIETLIALRTRPITKKDIIYDYLTPIQWLKTYIEDIKENTKIYVSSYNEIKDIASEYNLKSIVT